MNHSFLHSYQFVVRWSHDMSLGWLPLSNCPSSYGRFLGGIICRNKVPILLLVVYIMSFSSQYYSF